MGPRVRILSGVVLALALAPAAAIATRPSVSPVLQVPGYKGFASEGNGSKPELVARFDMTVAFNDIPGAHSYGYGMQNIRLLTDCSPSLIKVPGSIGLFSPTRRKVSQRIHFKYQRHGVNIHGYLFGSLSLPRVRATVMLTRPGCRDAFSFTAAWHKKR